jgi:hypothetical protein
MRRESRRAVALVAGIGLMTLAVNHPTADIRVLTHERTDPAPRVMKVVADLGVIGVSVLYTWTVDRLR